MLDPIKQSYTEFEDNCMITMERYSLYLQDCWDGMYSEHWDSTDPDVIQQMDQCKILMFQVNEVLRQMKQYHNVPIIEEEDSDIPF